MTLKYFSIFSIKSPTSWIAQITGDFLTCYSCSYSWFLWPWLSDLTLCSSFTEETSVIFHYFHYLPLNFYYIMFKFDFKSIIYLFRKLLIESLLAMMLHKILTLSRRIPIPYRNQSIDLLRKSMDWLLYDIGLRRERVKKPVFRLFNPIF